MIGRWLHGVCGDVVGFKRLRTSQLLVEVTREAQSKQLLESTSLVMTPIKVEPHKTLNKSRGVVRCRDLNYSTDEEILAELARFGVVEAKRMSFMKNGSRTLTSTYIMTFNTPKPPKEIRGCYCSMKVEAYVNNPMRCYKCQGYGHRSDYCKAKEHCMICGEEGHNDALCAKEAKCKNCKGNHRANAKICPRWITERDIQQVKANEHVSFIEAKRIVASRAPALVGYAQAARAAIKPLTMSFGTQTNMSWPDGNQYMVPVDTLRRSTPVMRQQSQESQTEVKSTGANPSTLEKSVHDEDAGASSRDAGASSRDTGASSRDSGDNSRNTQSNDPGARPKTIQKKGKNGKGKGKNSKTNPERDKGPKGSQDPIQVSLEGTEFDPKTTQVSRSRSHSPRQNNALRTAVQRVSRQKQTQNEPVTDMEMDCSATPKSKPIIEKITAPT